MWRRVYCAVPHASRWQPMSAYRTFAAARCPRRWRGSGSTAFLKAPFATGRNGAVSDQLPTSFRRSAKGRPSRFMALYLMAPFLFAACAGPIKRPHCAHRQCGCRGGGQWSLRAKIHEHACAWRYPAFMLRPSPEWSYTYALVDSCDSRCRFDCAECVRASASIRSSNHRKPALLDVDGSCVDALIRANKYC